MCGFSGMLLNERSWEGKRVVHQYLEDMARAVFHRGPDDHSKLIREKDYLGVSFQRLSILDLSRSARQPMLSRCKEWMIVYNGEVYNFNDLKKNISYKSDYWLTNSDTEVILENISKFGFSKSISMLNGMFAIAAYSFKTKTLWLARDKFGEKPLYYWQDKKKGFFFSSELKSLYRLPFYKKEISGEAFTNYLRFGYVPDPLSIIENTYKLMPGAILKYSENQELKISKYWDSVEEFKASNEKKFTGSYKEAIEEVKERIDYSCKNRLISDVPVGAFLSGGIDSSNLVYSLSRQKINIETFSVGFHDKRTNELGYANQIAKDLVTRHNEIFIDEDECINEIYNIVESYDEPFSDPSLIPTFLLSKHARKKVTVAISGDGADELFGGYPRYNKISQYWDNIKGHPIFLKNLFYKLSFKSSSSRIRILTSLGKKIRKLSHKNLAQLYNDEMSRWRPDEGLYKLSEIDSFEDENSNDSNTRISYFRSLMLKDIKTYLPSNLLVKIDRASMANSLEVRNPFLDENLVKFVWSLPDKYISQNNNKAILKDILLEKFPPQLIMRRKQGFEPPLEKWIRGPLKNWVSDLINFDDGLLDKKKIDFLYENFLRGEKKLTYKLWTIIMFKHWKLKNLS